MDNLPPGYETPIPQIASQQPSTLDAAYRVLGVPRGSSYADVKKAYESIKARLEAVTFPEGSVEQRQAQRIAQRADSAFMYLAETLDSSGDRFERLEI